MGFPALFPELEPPRLLVVPLIFLLASLHAFLSVALHLLGLGDLVPDDYVLPASSSSSSQWSDHILHHDLAVSSNNPAADGARLTPCRSPPAPAELVRELLPASTYADDVDPVGAAGSCCCTVCLCELRRGDEVRRLQGCRHVFHRRCLDPWVDLGWRTCPLCRTPLVSTDGSAVGPGATCEVLVNRSWYEYSIDDDDDDGADLDGFGSSSFADPFDTPSFISPFLGTRHSHTANTSPVAE